VSQTTGMLTAQEASKLRHDLRTPVNHIVGYCEMLLEDATDAGRTDRRPPLERAIALAREALQTINSRLTTGDATVSRAQLSELHDSLRQPRERIVETMTSLLTEAGTDEADFVEDVRRVIRSAEKLVYQDATVTGESRATDDVAGGGAATADANRWRILVVDDNPDNREILGRRLVRQGYAVATAENGSRALQVLRGGECDLVLLDIMMPEVDGYEVLQQLKEDPATRDIPVIMISALDDIGSIVRCIERGAEDYLPKPFDPVLLKARISASLEKKRLRDMEIEYLEQVKRVIEAASAVETGGYEAGSLASVAARDDQLGRLARVFDTMASQVKAREARLQRQVDDLKRAVEQTAEGAKRSKLAREAKLQVGQLFADRYEITAVIDGGGMGMVYRAHDRELDDDVAIKTLHPELISGDESLIERFKSEIRLTRLISHPSVVRTHDFGRWNGMYYLTMEYVEGVTARQLIDRQGRLGVPSTLAIATQLSRSLEVAHEQGVIHRDIKPQNLLLDREGTLKVLDFGVACLTERSGSLTQAGMIVGTPAYMAPEQLLEESVEARSDLYAVGVVLYECLTGTLPFEAGSTMALIAKILKDTPRPPDRLNPDVPPQLSAIILRLLSQNVAGRPATAAELSQLLAQIG